MAAKYEVIGNVKQFGYVKGEQFYADLTPAQERRKLDARLIRRVVEDAPAPPPRGKQSPATTAAALIPGEEVTTTKQEETDG